MAAQLPRPWTFQRTISDEKLLRAIERMTDFYNWRQRLENPEWVDVTPQVYFRSRVDGWIGREGRRLDPTTSEDSEVLRWHIATPGA